MNPLEFLSDLQKEGIVEAYLKEKGHSSSLIKRIMNPQMKSVKDYSKDEVCQGLILRSISPKAFEYIRTNTVCAEKLDTAKKLDTVS